MILVIWREWKISKSSYILFTQGPNFYFACFSSPLQYKFSILFTMDSQDFHVPGAFPVICFWCIELIGPCQYHVVINVFHLYVVKNTRPTVAGAPNRLKRSREQTPQNMIFPVKINSTNLISSTNSTRKGMVCLHSFFRHPQGALTVQLYYVYVGYAERKEKIGQKSPLDGKKLSRRITVVIASFLFLVQGLHLTRKVLSVVISTSTAVSVTCSSGVNSIATATPLIGFTRLKWTRVGYALSEFVGTMRLVESEAPGSL